jgi:hydrogenase-4 component B
VHVKPLFEKSLYDNTKLLVDKTSNIIYKLSNFEKEKYASLIFILLATVLFSYRVFAHQTNWGSILLEFIVMAIFIKIIIIGDKK